MCSAKLSLDEQKVRAGFVDLRDLLTNRDPEHGSKRGEGRSAKTYRSRSYIFERCIALVIVSALTS